MGILGRVLLLTSFLMASCCTKAPPPGKSVAAETVAVKPTPVDWSPAMCTQPEITQEVMQLTPPIMVMLGTAPKSSGRYLQSLAQDLGQPTVCCAVHVAIAVLKNASGTKMDPAFANAAIARGIGYMVLKCMGTVSESIHADSAIRPASFY